jgi:hypothetical protein
MSPAKYLLPALLFLVSVCVPAPTTAQTNIAGDWDLTINSPQGARTAPVSLRQDGEKITGMFKSQAGELPVEGTITGSDVKLAFTINFQGQPLPITMSGTADGASMAGKADFGGFAEGDFSAKRPGTTAAPIAPVVSSTATASTPEPTAAPAASAATGGAAGTWDVTLKMQGAEFPVTATLTDEAGTISGTMGSHLGELPVAGTIEGKTLKLSMVAKTPQGDIPVSLTGDVDGDAIVNGRAEFGGMGQVEWTARRRQ